MFTVEQRQGYCIQLLKEMKLSHTDKQEGKVYGIKLNKEAGLAHLGRNSLHAANMGRERPLQMFSAHGINIYTWMRRLCHHSEPGRVGAIFSWVWGFGVLDMSMPMSAIHIYSGLTHSWLPLYPTEAQKLKPYLSTIERLFQMVSQRKLMGKDHHFWLVALSCHFVGIHTTEFLHRRMKENVCFCFLSSKSRTTPWITLSCHQYNFRMFLNVVFFS